MKALKIILIVIFAILLVASAGLLGYGIMQGPKKPIVDDSALYTPPADNLFLGEYASKKIDIVAINNSNAISSASERAATMIINASYNNIYVNQFFYKASVNVQSTEHANRFAVSEYYRAKNGVNMFYETLAYTGTINPGQARIDYVDQRLESSCDVTYDTKTKEWGAGFKDVDRPKDNDGKVLTLPDANPYNIYSWYDFPLDLGGLKVCGKAPTAGRKEGVDFSLIDEKSVKIEEMADADGVAYYRISFKAIIDKAQNSKETIDRFSDSFSSLKNVNFSELNFEIDIWKDAGVFRKIGFDARVTASMGSDRGEVEIDKLLAFSYDDHDCSVAEHIYKFAEQYTDKWITKWSEKNRAQLEADIAALPKVEKEEGGDVE